MFILSSSERVGRVCFNPPSALVQVTVWSLSVRCSSRLPAWPNCGSSEVIVLTNSEGPRPSESAFVPNLSDPQRTWLVVAMASTLAGNFTMVGSVANSIVAYRAANRDIAISFWVHFRVGAPLTLATLASDND